MRMDKVSNVGGRRRSAPRAKRRARAGIPANAHRVERLIATRPPRPHIARADVACDGTGACPLFPFTPPGSAPQPRAGTDLVGRAMKEELMTFEGRIAEILPDGRFQVVLDNEHRIIAYTAGRMRRFRIRSIVGDRVHVEMSTYDTTKGRIVFREKLAGQAPGKRRGTFRRR